MDEYKMDEDGEDDVEEDDYGENERMNTGGVDIIDEQEIEGQEQEHGKVEDSERRTTKFLTKYEKARVLGTRALQIRYVCIVHKQKRHLFNGFYFSFCGINELRILELTMTI